MTTSSRKILVIDEEKFARICVALLEVVGYSAETISCIENLSQRIRNNEFGLIIVGYPYASLFLDEIKKLSLSTIVLVDHIDKDLMTILENIRNCCCMIKPLDYQRFRHVVNKFMGNGAEKYEGQQIF